MHKAGFSSYPTNRGGLTLSALTYPRACAVPNLDRLGIEPLSSLADRFLIVRTHDDPRRPGDVILRVQSINAINRHDFHAPAPVEPRSPSQSFSVSAHSQGVMKSRISLAYSSTAIRKISSERV